MPTDRAQNRPFYGWIALVLAALGMVATLPGRTQGLGLITTPLLRELHLSDVQWANINLVATLIGASFCIGFGRLIDRWGARRVMSGVIALLGLDLLAMSQARGLWSLFFTVTLTRGLGQSALSVVSLAIVGKWFIRRLPIAMGAYSVLIGIGFMIAFPAVQYAVEKDGWRAVWVGAGLVMIFVIAPLCALFMRRTPESIAAATGWRSFAHLLERTRSRRIFHRRLDGRGGASHAWPSGRSVWRAPPSD